MVENNNINKRKSSENVLFEKKLIAVRLRKERKTYKEISNITGLSISTICKAVKKFKVCGAKNLKWKKRGVRKGTNKTLTKRQENHIIHIMTDRTPEQLKLKCCLWTLDSVNELIKQEYGIDMPERTISEYLRRWGFTVQRPSKQAMNQKPEQVKEWVEKQYPEIRDKAKGEKAEIFWADETAVQNVANYARGYSPKGVTPVLKIQTVKMHINMISAINNQGKLHFLLYSEAINSERLIEFMEALIKHSRRKVYLIMDNLRVHHSKEVTEWAKEHEDEISLFYLPPYSPEYNPDEYLNNDLKRTIGTQAMVKNIKELEFNTLNFMKKLKKNKPHIKRYFKHDKIKWVY